MKKYKTINLITGLIAIIIGLAIFTVVYKSYNDEVEFFQNSEQVDGIVVRARLTGKNEYSIEYAYNIKDDQYTTHADKYKSEKELKARDKIVVHYNAEDPMKNMITEPNKNNLYIGLVFLTICSILGILTIVKYFKK